VLQVARVALQLYALDEALIYDKRRWIRD